MEEDWDEIDQQAARDAYAAVVLGHLRQIGLPPEHVSLLVSAGQRKLEALVDDANPMLTQTGAAANLHRLVMGLAVAHTTSPGGNTTPSALETEVKVDVVRDRDVVPLVRAEFQYSETFGLEPVVKDGVVDDYIQRPELDRFLVSITGANARGVVFTLGETVSLVVRTRTRTAPEPFRLPPDWSGWDITCAFVGVQITRLAFGQLRPDSIGIEATYKRRCTPLEWISGDVDPGGGARG